MPGCFVPGCKTSYRRCSVKLNMFRAPSDPVQLEKWRRAVAGSTDRVLTSGDYMCRLHFAPECIERVYDNDDDDDTGRMDLRLVEGAVPEMFPNSASFPSSSSGTKRRGRSSDGSSSSRSVSIPRKVQCAVPNPVLQNVIVSAIDGNDSGSQSLFSELRNDAEKFCPESWRSICSDDYVCFIRLQIISGQAQSTISVSISKDLEVQVFHGGLAVSHSFPDYILCCEDVTTMLQQLENSHIFVGTSSSNLVDTRFSGSGHADVSSELDLSTVCNPDISVTNMGPITRMDDEDVDWPEMKYVEIAPTENGIQGSGASAETTEHGSLQEGQSSVYVKLEEDGEVTQDSATSDTPGTVAENAAVSQCTQVRHQQNTAVSSTSAGEALVHFATTSNQHIQHLLEQDLHPSLNTQRIIDHAIAVFSAYARTRNTSLAQIHQMPQTEVNTLLQRFYAEVRKKDGSPYTRSGLVAVRYGLQKHFRNTCGYDIMSNPEFRTSGEVFSAILKQDAGAVQHRQPLSASDFNKLYSSSHLSTSNPTGLQNKVFVDIMLYLYNCSDTSRCGLRAMKKVDFRIVTDTAGRRYVTVSKRYARSSTATANSRSSGRELRMHWQPGNPQCPVASFEKYVGKLHAGLDIFWQKPRTREVREEDKCWYEAHPLGKNMLGSKMKTLSLEAGLSQVYTNHCIYFTSKNGCDWTKKSLAGNSGSQTRRNDVFVVLHAE